MICVNSAGASRWGSAIPMLSGKTSCWLAGSDVFVRMTECNWLASCTPLSLMGKLSRHIYPRSAEAAGDVRYAFVWVYLALD